MNLSEFRSYRDRFALASMLERGRRLESQADDALLRARALRKLVRDNPHKQHIADEYDATMREWASYEAMIGDIERDSRYIEWAKTQKLPETA